MGSVDKMAPMPGDLTIQQARLVLPDRCVTGDLLVRDGTIAVIAPRIDSPEGEVIDGRGLVCMPGAIDAQVRFREPGETHKEDLRTGSRAAAAGGVTSFLDMPSVHPRTTTLEALHDKLARAAEVCAVHYGFYLGATGDNVDEVARAERACGIKVRLADDPSSLPDSESLAEVFGASVRPIALHPEDPARLASRRELYAASTDVADHPRVHDVESALIATQHAVRLAVKHGARLHLMHVSSEEEADFLAEEAADRITAGVCLHHLLLDAETAYARLGTRVQCDPPIRSARHRDALWRHLKAGTFSLVTSDHAPHSRDEKARPYPSSPSGLPGVEWLLPLLLDRVNAGACTLSDVATWVCEGPARTWGLRRKGRLEVGYDGDLVLIDMKAERVITDASTRSKAGWSPWVGTAVQGWPVFTAILGEPVFRDGQVIDGVRGSELTYRRLDAAHGGAGDSLRPWKV